MTPSSSLSLYIPLLNGLKFTGTAGCLLNAKREDANALLGLGGLIMASANSILGQTFSVDDVQRLRDALDRVVKRGTFDVEKKRKRARKSSTKEMETISFSSHLARASKVLKTIQVTEEGDEIMDSDRISAARELISLSSRCDNMGRLASKAKQKGESS